MCDLTIPVLGSAWTSEAIARVLLALAVIVVPLLLSRRCRRPAWRGALLVHTWLFGLLFLYGAVFGESLKVVMSPYGASRDWSRGLPGGANAVANVVMYYVLSAGILALVVSAIGAAVWGIAAWAGKVVRM